MRCRDFDAHIDEMLSGILHPDASEHMRECERCSAHYRARVAVRNELRELASASRSGPSLATDRAVMASFRRLQERRVAAAAGTMNAKPAVRLFSFPSRRLELVSRIRWTGAVAAGFVFAAVLGSAFHLWNGGATVHAPTVASAPAVPASGQAAVNTSPAPVAEASLLSPDLARLASPSSTSTHTSARSVGSHIRSIARQMLASRQRPHSPASPEGWGTMGTAGANAESLPLASTNTGSVMRMASTGTVSNMAESASSTWPGYSNLMYCDPVVCSGPMQVVRIKVPVKQVQPNLGQTVGNGFVNAEVVVGPDGVARAIRVAN
jgi:hypothetical protein